MPLHEEQIFEGNIELAYNALATSSALSLLTTAAVDTSDLLRFALVQGVSSFDHFIHEEVRTRMVMTILGQHARATAFEKFRVSLGSLTHAISGSSSAWLEREVREQHGILSFQKPDKVADALRLVSDVRLWDAIAAQMGRTPGDVKVQLVLIVDRRNKIVHEADMDPTPPRSRYPISESMVGDSLDFLAAIVKAIRAVT